MDRIVTRAPTRIDFGGGWTDVPPYSDEMGGFVCNLAIARYATVTVTRGRERGGPNDSRAADALQRLFPTRRVHPVRAENLVWGMGTIHCLSQQQPAS